MSLQLILGSSGSGKTSWVNRFIIEESMAHPDRNYMILVPEQFTMETQREIAQIHPRRGTMNIDILSFVRLAHKVFAERGCQDYVVLDDMGKCVILQKAALKQADSLKVFGRNLKRRGFISELKSMLSELYQYGITPDQLESARTGLSDRSILSGKLQDMITVYRAFAGELEEGTITAEEILPVMCRFLPDSQLIRDAVMVLDGFTGFTPVQYQVISLLLQYGGKVMVTVTVDPLMDYRKETLPHELFYLSCHTVNRLLDLAAELEITCEPDICILRSEKEQQLMERKAYGGRTEKQLIVPVKSRFSDMPELAFLEKHVLRFSREQYEKVSASDHPVIHSLYLSVCKSPADEVRSICSRIYDLVMNQGYRYREIAVITGNPEAYGPLFKQELEQCGIPFFMDQKNSLMNNPLVEYIRSLFEIMLKDFSYESMFRFLKCGLGSLSREDRDYLENYVIATGVRGRKRWSEDWERQRRSGAYTDFERLNRIRRQAAEPLLGLHESWSDRKLNVRSRIEILVRFLQEQDLQTQMTEKCSMFRQQGQLLLAKEYEQAWDLIMALLNEIETLMGQEVLSLQDFSACFDSGLEEIRVGLIPACTDRLLVGDMERTRLSGVKILFFAGVNEGQVPKNSSGGGIFTDYDKEQLLSLDIELSPTGRMSSFMDRFYLYLALTRPSDRLYISYAKNDGDGRAMRPASCIAELLSLYPGLSIFDEEDAPAEKSSFLSPAGVWRYLVQGFSDPEYFMENPVWMQVYCYYYQKNREQVEQLLCAMSDGYVEESLTSELAVKLYGQALQASVSRLEQQAACAFSHFLRYGLKLGEREVFSFETADMGNLFHSALEKYFRKVREEKLDITSVEEAKRKELVQICVADAARELGGDVLGDTARSRWLAGRLERITDRTVWALGEQLKEGGYETDGCEVVFEPDNTEAFTIPLTPDLKMMLRGRIDRIDTRQEEDRLYVRIVDYKSGSRSFDLVSVYYGLQIQLVFYMEAAQENLKKRNRQLSILPGGVLYYNIGDPVVDRTPGMEEEDVKAAILNKLQMNGMVTRSSLEESEREAADKKKGSKISVVSDLQFSALQKYIHHTVRTLGQEIMEGRIAVDPYVKGQTSACTWCSYKSICGFDRKRRGYGYRNLASISKDEVWKRIMEDAEDEDDLRETEKLREAEELHETEDLRKTEDLCMMEDLRGTESGMKDMILKKEDPENGK
ncbi:MAG: PD-(D/E)XK nuclease family protein [Lachnospiraceae bacterium]|nr:PD-(D/E)XK nuclease family protein [Lachnospiraceae bacterium]